jgi:prevent-host-death family protein
MAVTVVVVTEFGMHEAKTHLSQLVERALAGEEIVVTRRGKPAVRLTPVAPAAGREALFDCMAGEIEFLDGYDDELPDDMAEAFGVR